VGDASWNGHGPASMTSRLIAAINKKLATLSRRFGRRRK
jgi:hypothetical protein